MHNSTEVYMMCRVPRTQTSPEPNPLSVKLEMNLTIRILAVYASECKQADV